jgi:hypothetical protein
MLNTSLSYSNVGMGPHRHDGQYSNATRTRRQKTKRAQLNFPSQKQNDEIQLRPHFPNL